MTGLLRNADNEPPDGVRILHIQPTHCDLEMFQAGKILWIFQIETGQDELGRRQ